MIKPDLIDKTHFKVSIGSLKWYRGFRESNNEFQKFQLTH